MQTDDELRQIVAGYVADVLEGRRIVGRLERLCVERHVTDLARIESGERKDWRFDEAAALEPLQFAVRFVRHTKGQWAGKRYTFNSRSAWIAFLFWCAFGWYARQSDGTWQRRFDEVLVCTARKQGKSMIAAIIALFLYVLSGEAAPEIYFGATQREQAAIAWKQAAGIVKKDQYLSKRLRILPSQYHITKHDDFEAVFKPLSRNDDEFDGLNPFCVILDEVHAHPDSGLYDVLRSGQGARRSPMRWLITTRGVNPESFYAQHEKAMINVLEGVLDEDSTFAFIACLDDGDDYKDPRNWPKANPNIGVTVTEDKIRRELVRALNSKTKLPEFLRKQMNVWTVGSKAWLPLSVWDACGAPLDPADLIGGDCCLGIDLSKSDDFTAAAAVFHRPNSELIALLKFWIPSEKLEERAATGKVPIRAWVESGLIELCEGQIVDQDAVKAWVHECRKRYKVHDVAFDPAQSWKLAGELIADGVENVMEFPQAWVKMHAATREVEDAIRKGRLRHGGNPVLRWMFTNVVTRTNASGLVRLDKAKSPDKIDGITALLMAASRAMLIVPKKPSIYKTRGVIHI